jgi:biopolymer transport protein ExbD
MRRFSQRGSLVTLSEINITPLLDLAFVLLIIFIITTPLLEQGLDVKLPTGGRPDQPLKREDVRTVEVGVEGFYVYGGQRMSLTKIEQELVKDARSHPNLVVNLRADKRVQWDLVLQVMDICAKRGIAVTPRTVAQ